MVQRPKWWSGFYSAGTYNVGMWRECQVTTFQANGGTNSAFDLWGNDAGSSSQQSWTLIVLAPANVKVTCYD